MSPADSSHRVPEGAAWTHVGGRTGFEVLFQRSVRAGMRFEGQVTAVEHGLTWAVGYAIEVDPAWVTRRAEVTLARATGSGEVVLGHDGEGHWRVDDRPAPELDGCLDVDLEASAFTNALVVRRLGLAVGESAPAPAAWVRAPGLEVELLEQRYARTGDADDRARYAYAAPGLGFSAELAFDRACLVVDYPGIAVRVG